MNRPETANPEQAQVADTTSLPQTGGEDGDSTWAPLKSPVFAMIWGASIFSSMGSWMHDAGAAWLMRTLVQDPLIVALVPVAVTGSIILMALPSGALADILDRRRFLIASQGWMMLWALTLAITTTYGVTSVGLLLAITFAMGLGAALSMPAWSAMVPDLVPRHQLGSAVTLNSMAMNGTRAVGPTVAGLLIAWAGPKAVFFVNAASFLAIIAAMYKWDYRRAESTLPAERVLGAIKVGLRFARRTPEMVNLFVRGFVFFLFSGTVLVLLPMVVTVKFGEKPQFYGALLGCLGLGAVLAGPLMRRLAKVMSRHLLVALATLLHAGTMVGVSLGQNMPVLMSSMFIGGFAWMAAMVSIQIAAQMTLPAWVRARGLAMLTIFIMGGLLTGSLLWGYVARHTGVEEALLLSAGAAALGVALTWRFRLPHEQGDHHDAAEDVPDPDILLPVAGDQGPVMVTVEYMIDPRNAGDFALTMRDVRAIRLRNGAISWGLFHDTEKPGRFLEYFIDESWLEHLRTHRRLTIGDRRAFERTRRYHIGSEPPKVGHFVAEELPSFTGTDKE